MSRMFTFGLDYGDGGIEEIDVRAARYEEAYNIAETIAARDYQPGYSIIDLAAGGEFGMVTSWK